MTTRSFSFKDNLGALLDKHLAARESERGRVKDLRLRWEEIRREVVAPVFAQAVEVLNGRAPSLEAKWERNNGCIVLESGDGEQPGVRHQLRLGLDEQKGEAVCTSTLGDALTESFSLDRLDGPAVQSKVELFVEALFLGSPEKRPAAWLL